MPSLNIIDAGAASIQGLGRYGSQRYGIAPGGAMDRMALAEANALTGQPAGMTSAKNGDWTHATADMRGTPRSTTTGQR